MDELARGLIEVEGEEGILQDFLGEGEKDTPPLDY